MLRAKGREGGGAPFEAHGKQGKGDGWRSWGMVAQKLLNVNSVLDY